MKVTLWQKRCDLESTCILELLYLIIILIRFDVRYYLTSSVQFLTCGMWRFVVVIVRISNEEFSWDREGLTDVRPVCGPGERISEEEVEAAIGKMKLGKAAGPSGVVADMLKAAGEDGTRWMTELCNAVVRDGKIPED